MDEIRIEGLEVYAYHGVYEEENRNGQTFFINAVLNLDLSKAGWSDDLSNSVNYGSVCEYIYKWMTSRTVKLIETVAEQLARDLLIHFRGIESISLEIRKPEAPIKIPFESVSVKVNRGWHTAYISFGSNMGDKLEHINNAIEQLKSNPSIKLGRVSEFIMTKPYGGVEQDDFVNGALEIKTLLSPTDLLGALHMIEFNEKRERLVHWGPRTLDLDIIFYDKLIYEDDDLIIPHVDMQNREFVLKPLAEIAPNYRHPILLKTVSELLAALNK